MSTPVIAFANAKGGVAKTTTALSVGNELGRLGRKILFIDLDGQASLTETLIDFTPSCGTYELFTRAKTRFLLDECIVPGSRFVHPSENVDLIPSSGSVKELEAIIVGKTSHEMILRKALRALDLRRWDAVIVDCPPSLGALTANAMTACTELYVPVTPEFMPVSGLSKLREQCDEVGEDLNPGLAITGIVVTRYDGRLNLHKAALSSLQESFGDAVFASVIHNNVSISESPQTFQDVIAYAPKSTGAADYKALTDEIERRLWP